MLALCRSLPDATPARHHLNARPIQSKVFHPHKEGDLHATGPFEVKIDPQPPDERAEAQPSAACSSTSGSTATSKPPARAPCSPQTRQSKTPAPMSRSKSSPALSKVAPAPSP